MKSKRNPEAIKLFENIKKHSDIKTAEKIAFGMNLPLSPSKMEYKNWISNIISQLEKHFDDSTIKSIRSECYCDENGKLQENKMWLKDLYSSSKNIEEFVNKVNEHSTGWYIEDGKLYTKYLDCACPMIQSFERLETKTWCYCTIGFAKEIFNDVFGYEVKIDVLKTIKMGSDFCLIQVSNKNGGPLV